jgi:TRAP-type C4-dicarboxylate transport system substrate-binding protein
MSKADDVETLMPELNKVFEQGYSKWGIKYLANFLSPDRTLNIYCKTPVNTLEDLRKKKLRVWSKTLVDTFGKLGVSATIIPQNDMYVAMQTGVVDCATYYPGAANTVSLQEVAPNWAYLSPYAVPIELIVSQKAFSALPPDIQKILQEEAQKMEKELTAAFLEGTYEAEEAKKFNAAGGKKLPDFPKADQEAMNKAAKEVWLDTSKQLGGKVWENYQHVSAALKN